MSPAKSKASNKASSKDERGKAISEEERLLCCVPDDVVECFHRVIAEPGTGIKMGCSNLQCTSQRLLHPKCFEKLEKHLVTATKRLLPKSGRLNEVQLKASVWDIRGQEVLKRMCKCSCGGTLRKEEEVDVPLPAPVVQKKEKASPKKPKLNSLPGRICEQKTFIKRGNESKVAAATHDEQILSKSKPAQDESPPSPGKLDHQSPKSRQPLPLLKSDLPVNLRNKTVPYGPSYKYEDPAKKVFVYHLPKTANEEDLCDLFEDYGDVKRVWISTPPSTYAFVLFESVESVDSVMASLPIMLYGSHPLRVERKKSSGENEGNNTLLPKEETKKRPDGDPGRKISKTNLLGDAILRSNVTNPSQDDSSVKTNSATKADSSYVPKSPVGDDSFFNPQKVGKEELLERETECLALIQENEDPADFYWSDGEYKLDERPDKEEDPRFEAENQALQGGMAMVKELLRLKELKEADCLKLETENEALREAMKEQLRLKDVKEAENEALREQVEMLEAAFRDSQKMCEGRKKIIEEMHACVLKSYLGEASFYRTKPKPLESETSTPDDWERSS